MARGGLGAASLAAPAALAALAALGLATSSTAMCVHRIGGGLRRMSLRDAQVEDRCCVRM
eukprot:1802866-Alexandrium_andersonii.AAC.1